MNKLDKSIEQYLCSFINWSTSLHLQSFHRIYGYWQSVVEIFRPFSINKLNDLENTLYLVIQLHHTFSEIIGLVYNLIVSLKWLIINIENEKLGVVLNISHTKTLIWYPIDDLYKLNVTNFSETSILYTFCMLCVVSKEFTSVRNVHV